MEKQKRNKIIYYVSTGLLTVMMLMSVGMYIFKHADVAAIFTKLGYPTYIIYPLAIAKFLGIVAIWTNKSRLLKEWAYAGFFFVFGLAATAHCIVEGGMTFMPPVIATVLLLTSYYSGCTCCNKEKS